MKRACLTALATLGAAFVSTGAPPEPVLVQFGFQQLTDQFWCEGASFADFNNDGKQDVVAGPWWWQGPDFKTRHEIYPAAVTFDLPLGPQTQVSVPGYEGGLGKKNKYSDNFFAFPHDFNADGWMDVLVIGFPGKATAWFENPKTTGQPWTRHVVFLKTDNESPTFTDINGDGKPELVCITGGAYGYATVDWKAPANGWKWHRISPNRNYGNFTHGMGVGDVNGDGRADLLEKTGWWEQPSSLEGDPEWTRHEFAFSKGPGGAQMFAYDVNGDGLNDVITSLAAHAYGLSWFEQVKQGGAIAFKEHVIMGARHSDSPYGVKFSELHALDLVDMDGDGLKDIVTGKRFWSHGLLGDPDRNDEAVLYWFQLQRTPDGVDWVPRLISKQSGVGTQVVAGDVNADGRPDVVVGNKKGVFVHLQQARRATQEEWLAARPKPLPPARPAQEFPARDPEGRVLNLDFEAGSLKDWEATGTAFDGNPQKGDAVNRRRQDMRSGHAGEHWAGSYEAHEDKATGTLTSTPFVADQPYASFLIGGGSGLGTRVEIVNAASGAVVATCTGPDNELMKHVYVDLCPVQGALLRVRVVDEATGRWGHVNFDHFRLHDAPPAQAYEARSAPAHR